MQFRQLRANEIDCRIGSCSDKGLSILLYKDARCDQNILDESVGPMNWQRHHSRDNANCIVSIWDSEKGQWIEKEDTGTESYTEKEKGLASDSFKRACFNWGIGRELYTAPFIWFSSKDAKIEQKNGKNTCYDKFYVSAIEYEDNTISYLKVVNKSMKSTFIYGQPKDKSANGETLRQDYYNVIVGELKRTGISAKSMLDYFKVGDIMELTEAQAIQCMRMLKEKPDKEKAS